MNHSPVVRRYLASCTWSFGGKLASIGTLLATNALLARVLSLSDMGSFVLLQSFAVIASMSAQLGLPQAMVRLIAEALALEEPGKVRGVIRLAFAGTTLLTLLAAGLVALVGAPLPGPWTTEAGQLDGVGHLLLLWVLLIVWEGIQGASFRGFNDLRFSTIFEGMLHSVLFFLLLAALATVSDGITLRQALVCSVLAGTVSVLTGVLPLRHKLKRLRQVASPIRLPELLRVSLPLLMITLCSLLLNQSDLWIIGWYRSTAEVALYNSVARLAQIVSTVMVVLNVAVSPLIAELKVQGRLEELEELLRGISAFACLPALAALLVLAVWGDSILGIVFGSGYRAGGHLVLILSLGHLCTVWAGACGLALVMTGEQNALMVLTVACSVLTVLGSFLLVRRFGVTGVALASSAGMALQSVLTLLLVKRRMRIWTHANFRLDPGALRLAAARRS